MNKQTKDLIFTYWEGDNGVFFESDTWYALLGIQNALEKAKTWGEFRTLMPKGEFEELWHWLSNTGEKIYWDGEKYLFIEPEQLDQFLKDAEGDEDYYIIRASDEFDSFGVPGVPDGDYPQFISSMLEGFTEEFNDKFGEQIASYFSGVWWEFPMDDFVEMKEYLFHHGFSVEKVD